MKLQDKVSKGLERILRKMCEIVNCDYENFNFDNPQWFLEYEWTEEQEEEFKKWMTNAIMNDKEIRRDLLEFSFGKPTKKFAERVANNFIFNYGWKLKKEVNE